MRRPNPYSGTVSSRGLSGDPRLNWFSHTPFLWFGGGTRLVNTTNDLQPLLSYCTSHATFDGTRAVCVCTQYGSVQLTVPVQLHCYTVCLYSLKNLSLLYIHDTFLIYRPFSFRYLHHFNATCIPTLLIKPGCVLVQLQPY